MKTALLDKNISGGFGRAPMISQMKEVRGATLS